MTAEEVLKVRVAYRSVLSHLVGDPVTALYLSQILYITDRKYFPRLSGWASRSRQRLFEETGLSKYQQERARRVLKEKKILYEELRGMPRRLFFFVDRHLLRCAAGELAENWSERGPLLIDGKGPVIADWSQLASSPPARREVSYQQEGDLFASQLVRNSPTVNKSLKSTRKEEREGSERQTKKTS